jgi:ATP-binding cassette subfamily C protein
VTSSIATLKATRIVVAHRLSTIAGADRIFFIERGRIVESGTYQELMELNGRFKTLAERQLL